MEVHARGTNLHDGSCLYPTQGTAAVAGCAMVQMDEDGDVLRSIQITLPNDLPATAAMAEHVAANITGLYTTGAYSIVTDCMSVMLSAKGAEPMP